MKETKIGSPIVGYIQDHRKDGDGDGAIGGGGGGCEIKTCRQNGAGIQELVFASDSAGVTHQHTSKIAENMLGNYLGYLRK